MVRVISPDDPPRVISVGDTKFHRVVDASTVSRAWDLAVYPVKLMGFPSESL